MISSFWDDLRFLLLLLLQLYDQKEKNYRLRLGIWIWISMNVYQIRAWKIMHSGILCHFENERISFKNIFHAQIVSNKWIEGCHELLHQQSRFFIDMFLWILNDQVVTKACLFCVFIRISHQIGDNINFWENLDGKTV